MASFESDRHKDLTGEQPGGAHLAGPELTGPELTGPPIEVTNPLTGEVIGTVPDCPPEVVFRVVERARTAQPAWVARGDLGRARFLRLWADALWDHRDRLVALIRQETGKNEAGAIIEIMVLDVILAHYARTAPRTLRPRRRRALLPFGQYARVHYRPYGVVGFITPWNYPYLNALQDAVAALVAGNAAIIKPSEITPLTVRYAVALAHRVGIPRDVLQVVTGGGGTGAALVDGVDYIALTGSTVTGRKVAQRAAQRLIPYTLELGGKDPVIVLDDLDERALDDAARGVLLGALENAGQVCVSVERVYVLDGVYDRFVARITALAEQLKIGPGGGLDVHVGSMTNAREIARCEAQIADAVAKGARVLIGGRRRPDLGPLFFEPAILVDVDHTMQVMCEETFGPLIPIMRVRSVDEAVRLANESRYGLSSSIFGGDLARAEQLAERLVAGDTSINRAQIAFATPTLPTGGRRESGVGRRNGPEGLLRFVTPHSVLVDRGWVVNRTLTQLDPFLYRGLTVARKLRRWLPWLTP